MCPECGSNRIELSARNDETWDASASEFWECKDCGTEWDAELPRGESTKYDIGAAWIDDAREVVERRDFTRLRKHAEVCRHVKTGQCSHFVHSVLPLLDLIDELQALIEKQQV